MKMDKILIALLIAVLITPLLVAGCQTPHNGSGESRSKEPGDQVQSKETTTKSQARPQRFKDPGQDEKTAVESAIEISRKYADLSERTAELRQKNIKLISEKHKLENEITTLKAKLSQTEKELKQANDMLLEMQIELNNWKANILGFRDEMRQAEKAELQTLLKIVKLLGGEIEEAPAAGELLQKPSKGDAISNEPNK